MGEGDLDRRQRARGQDRACDDDAGRGLLIDHQPGADAEHGRLQDHAQDPGKGGHAAGDVGDALLGGEIAPVVIVPQLVEAAAHAHGLHDLGIAAARFGEPHATVGDGSGVARRLPGQELGGHGDGDQDQAAHRRRPADQRMEHEADAEIERHPRQVEEGRRSHGRHEGADAVEVMHRLEGGRRDGLERQLAGEIEDAMAQRLVDRGRQCAPARGRAGRRAGPGSRTSPAPGC